MSKTVPFNKEKALGILAEHGSPLYVYDEKGIRDNAQKLNDAFAWSSGYKNYFAVKATPTPGILRVLREEGMGFDCSSRSELLLMQGMGVSGNDIFFTSNNTPREDFELAIELGVIVNIDDLTQVPVFLDALGDKEYDSVAVRYNPGDEHGGNEIIGQPTEAKYGMSLEQVIEAYEMLSKANIKHLGLHTMVASNELHEEFFVKTAQIIKNAVKSIEVKMPNAVKFVNLGGGFGIPYNPEDSALDYQKISDGVRSELEELGVEIYTENGRAITGPYGYLLTSVRYVMEKYKTYVGVDASMHNLMRPGMYGAYHHISVLGKGDDGDMTYDVVGSLCENNDKFAIDRRLPEVEPGDILVIHDAGAHGHAMGFNYNGLLRSAEVLLHEDGSTELVRRVETFEDYSRTIQW